MTTDTLFEFHIADILKDSNYSLTQFEEREIEAFNNSIVVREIKGKPVPYVKCIVREKEIKLTPEEIVRQLFVRMLIQRYQYPVKRMALEVPVNFGREIKRADIVVFDKDRPNVPYIMVEIKKPKLKDGKEQLRSYCNATGSPMGVWSNGGSISYYHRKDPNYFEDITDIPTAHQSLSDVLNERFNIDDLIAKDKLINEKKSLKDLILEMEDEVLANAGVDVFEEVFKLVFTKLFDEMSGVRQRSRLLEFRNTGQTETELKNKIQTLFDKAKKQWEGVFTDDAQIMLTPSHLSICVSSLQNVKLFNSNLDVVDEAFEYLINKSSKGEKGQYFTPRYVIDMCVKMLNPKEHEYLIDTAAGSAGFTVHSIFYVWKQIQKELGLPGSHLFTAEQKQPRQIDYVQEKVFAIDFDEKSVRVARTLNLIAGDGQTNVLHMNSLDYERWNETVEDERWRDTYFNGWKKLKRLVAEKNSFKKFQFDLLLANPPFAGDIKESRILAKYELGKKPDGKWQNAVGRDILFIERNLDFLKPGGRMAVVLPQGRFNNASDKPIRDFIAEHCRILAVVGLHGNTFKPHTGTKTSVLFVQKWNDDEKAGPLCPKVDDYNIFFATMRKPGKDNSGEKIHVKNPKAGLFGPETIRGKTAKELAKQGELELAEPEEHYDKLPQNDNLLDEHGHLIVDHDLFNHEGLTQDGIAEAFIEFAKKEDLSFFSVSPFVEPFDAEKYQRQMDGLEAVEMKFMEVRYDNLSFRKDAEYFLKHYVQDAKTLHSKGSKKLVDITFKIDVGFVGPMVKEYRDRGVALLQTKNIDAFFIDENDVKYITLRFHKELYKSQIKKHDVLLARSGSFGKASIYLNEEIINSSDIIIVEADTNKINPFYLTAFLNSRLGVNQLLRYASGGLQGHVNLTILENLKIPILDKGFQNSIEKIITEAYEVKCQSEVLYKQVEALLLGELSLHKWQPTSANTEVKSFKNSFLESGRLDAEYYQPKYDEVEFAIKNKSNYFKTISEIRTFNVRGLQPEYFEDGDLDVINSKHILENTLDYNNFEKTKNNYWDLNSRARVYKNDILTYTTGANIGRTHVYLNDKKALASNHVNILRIKDENPIYVGFVMNSILGRLQTEKLSAGSAQQELYPKDIDNFLIPFISKESQEVMCNNVLESLNLQQQCQQLLEAAKQAVEIAIEEGEDKATEFITAQNVMGEST